MDSSRAYAADLHRVLLQSRVPHKIVSVSFAFRTDYTPSGNTQRTLVVYQDTTARQASWWVMDERLNVPVWLPDKPLEQQVSFYLARPVTVLEVSDYTNLTDGKSVIPLETGAPPSGTTQIEPVTPRVIEPARRRSGGKKSPKAETKPGAAPKVAAKPRTGASPRAADSAEPVSKARSTEAVAQRPAAGSSREDGRLLKKEMATADAKPGPVAEKKKSTNAAPSKDAKPAAKKEAFPEQPELAVEKPQAEPALIEKAEPAPQAAVLPEAGEKKTPPSKPEADQPVETPKPQEAPKTSSLRRWFRKVFRA